MVRDTIRFGRRVAANYWLGVSRPDDAMLYRALPLYGRVLFWAGAVLGLCVIYREYLYTAFVVLLGALLVLAVVLGWGPF